MPRWPTECAGKASARVRTPHASLACSPFLRSAQVWRVASSLGWTALDNPAAGVRIPARPRLSTFTRCLVPSFVHELAMQRTMRRGCMPARGS
jgi:hypothetical protein